MHSPAYFAVGAKADVARDVPAFQRLLPAGPWSVVSAPHPDYGWGALAWWADCPQPGFDGIWRQSPDGLWYRAPDVLPSQAELAKANCPPGIVVTLLGGTAITMPLAALAPRKLSFSARSLGEPADVYGRLAFSVRERLKAAPEGLSVLDPEVLEFLAAGIGLAYRVTTELLDDLGWVTDGDVDPLLCAGMGSDPKACAGGATSSRSPAEGSPT